MKKINILFLSIIMLCIFFFSSQVSSVSSKSSNKITQTGIKVVNKIGGSTEKNIKKISNHIDIRTLVRKSAHFIEFFLLGLLIINVLKDYFKISWKIILIALFLCILYACSDEIHQLFVPGRTSRIFDILIDTSGSILGIFLYYICYKFINIRKIGKNA